MSDQEIIERWKKNANSWTVAVREGRIRSRLLVTDAAIVDAILQRSPRAVLDVGCGEGWLACRIAGFGIDVLGIDIVPALVEDARRQGGGRFEVVAYEMLAEHGLNETFDVCVCNFSLLGEQVTGRLLAVMPRLLAQGGAVIVQTLHAMMACGDEAYRDGWRQGSWFGIAADFGEPAPWYFRTMHSGMQMFSDSCLAEESILEPSIRKPGGPHL